MIATRDIAARATKLLVDSNCQGKWVVELQGPQNTGATSLPIFAADVFEPIYEPEPTNRTEHIQPLDDSGSLFWF